MSPIHRHSRLSLPLIALLSFACGTPADRPLSTVAELASDLPFSRQVAEIDAIDLGAAGSGVWLDDGWSHIEQSGDKKGFRWAVGESSSLHFDLVSQRDLQLEMVARPFPFEDGRAQTMEVLVNGTSVTSLEMKSKWNRYRVSVPAALQNLGSNRIRFLYRHFRPLEASQNRAGRRFAVAWRRIEIIEPLVARTAPATVRDGSTLFVPTGNRLEFFVEIPDHSRLRIDGIQPRGDQAGRLLIAAATDETSDSPLLSSKGASSSIDEPLLGGQAGILRLSVTVEPDVPPPANTGFLLERPRLVAAMEEASADQRQQADSRPRSPARRPNILIYLVDTLRTDAIGSYQAKRPLSPRFDEFASDATLFENTVGQSSWTRASVASLFTGLWPYRHGAVGRLDKLATEAETLPELLSAAGYYNVAFITNPNVTGKFGFAQGFDEFAHIRTDRTSDKVNQWVFAWLEDYADSRPFFLYVHTMDPHHPYLPPEPMRPAFARTEGEMRTINRLLSTTPRPPGLQSNIDRFRALYDGAARFNDHSFGELLEELSRKDLLEETVVLFLSDHGEEFFEHGAWQHGKNLHAETLNVPLAVRFPDIGHGRRIGSVAGHVDILPTLLDYLDIAQPTDLDGGSLLPRLETGDGASAPQAGRSFSHLSLDGHESVAVVDGEWKLIVHKSARGTPLLGLYRWTNDPEEHTNLAAERPILTHYLESLIARKVATNPPRLTTEEAELDSELERSLRALGYLR